MDADEKKKYLAEMFGTFALVFFGCGSAVIAGQYIGYLGIAFAFGFVLLVMVYAIGNISGCHVNPAVTFAMLMRGKIDQRTALAYILSQCVGAIIGAAILLSIAMGNPDYSVVENGLGQNGYGAHSPAGYGMAAAFLAEVILTAVFLLIIFGATSSKAPEGFAGLIIGFGLALVHIFGIPVTGTSVNPARSLGPAIFTGSDAMFQLWLFWLAPLIGAVLAVSIWKILADDE
jgi:aquaporin Z